MLLTDISFLNRRARKSRNDAAEAAEDLSQPAYDCAVRSGHVLITVRGDVAGGEARQLLGFIESARSEYETNHVVLDLAEAGRVDAAAVAALEQLAADCESAGGALLCAQMSLDLEIALRQTGLAIALRLPAAWPRRMLA